MKSRYQPDCLVLPSLFSQLTGFLTGDANGANGRGKGRVGLEVQGLLLQVAARQSVCCPRLHPWFAGPRCRRASGRGWYRRASAFSKYLPVPKITM